MTDNAGTRCRTTPRATSPRQFGVSVAKNYGVFTAMAVSRRLKCVMIRQFGAGWELVVRIDDEIPGARRDDSEGIAKHYANALRGDYVRDGWMER